MVKKPRLFIALCTLPALILTIVFMIVPMVNAIYLSFTSSTALSVGFNSKFVFLDNYKYMFQDKDFLQALFNTLKLMLVIPAVTIFLSLVFAFILTQGQLKEKSFYRTVFFFPSIVSMTVVGIVWSFVFNPTRGILNHMLDLFARHGRFDLVLTCHGDVEVDYHHTTEDVGIALGQAFAEALGDMRGIHRYGSFYLPMDEALILCAVDISGRCTLNWDIRCQTEKVGDFDVECAKEFWLGFARSVPATVHFVQFAGENTHHILEAAFKGAGRALADAVRIDAAHRDEIPSTKGLLV